MLDDRRQQRQRARQCQGLNSTGQTYGHRHWRRQRGEDAALTATFNVSDLSADVKVLGLRGNSTTPSASRSRSAGEPTSPARRRRRPKTDGNPSFSIFGTLNAGRKIMLLGRRRYEPRSSTNEVSIVNLDTGTTVRPLNVTGIDIDNADSVAVNVAGNRNDLVLQSTIGSSSVEALTFRSSQQRHAARRPSC
jgi:hypothetical protein